ncbi:class I SAM-dependent methyltransferase [Rhodovulum sulfidophilum]|uniref:class I SAM-dependent methyltransferase n=1 Tax=Rhodovulum sulfidophilum TaxID=35806 RepID=UPI001389F65B|nr:class I SAM-dependent methyltransferase [Rhodovulum sulfidophilum]NDK36697.1 class I SAM-dependent methyltransferase [Rhodovulum sulfidophilum]
MTDPIRTTLDVLLELLSPLGGRRVLDIGCGRGGLAVPFRAAGADWRGLEPCPQAGGAPGIDVAEAQAMPYPDAVFDIAVIVNALHHIPVGAMGHALAEAARVIAPEAVLVVIEPRVEGDLSQVIATVDDETKIRHAAQAALDAAVAAGVLAETRAFDYVRREIYEDFEAFMGRISSFAPERGALSADLTEALRAAFLARAGREGAAFILTQPMSARLFRRGPAAG